MASATNSDDDGDNVSADGSSLSSGLELKKEASRKVQQPPKLIFFRHERFLHTCALSAVGDFRRNLVGFAEPSFGY